MAQASDTSAQERGVTMSRMDGTLRSTPPSWSRLLLPAILVAIVAGAYWLKVRPISALSGGQESTDALLARGVSLHAAQQYDAALEAYRKILEREPTHHRAHYNIGQI